MKTSKIVFSLFTALIVGFTAKAQSGSSFGIKGGLNYGGNGDYFESAENTYRSPDQNIGYHFGVFGKVGSSIYFRPELVYTKTKSDYNGNAFDMSKLDMPLLVGLKVLGPIHAFAGPSFQYILDTEFDGFTIGEVEDEFTVGVNFGFGLSLGNIGLDLRYERGFKSNEVTVIRRNNIVVSQNRIDTRPEQIILSLSVKL